MALQGLCWCVHMLSHVARVSHVPTYVLGIDHMAVVTWHINADPTVVREPLHVPILHKT